MMKKSDLAIFTVKFQNMILYKVILLSAVVTELVILYYFFVGLADGSIDSTNGLLWFFIVTGTIVIIISGIWLKHTGHLHWAKVILSLLAIPGWLYGLYILLIVLTKSRWN